MFFIGLTLITNSIHSQTKTEISIYNWYDNLVGKENLDFNTGKIYTNPYKTNDGSILFFENESFTTGNLTYKGNKYYQIPLKYDVFRDILVLNPSTESESTAISLNQDKIESFSIYGKNFIKINKGQYSNINLRTGYYENLSFTENFIFYIEHSKKIEKRAKEEVVSYAFKSANQFYLALDGKAYLVNSKREIIKLFPSIKNQINDFYTSNNSIRKSDLDQFMRNLFQSISISSSNKAQ